MTLWRWLLSNDSLPYRIAIGGLIFAAMAIADLRRNGSRATRWREYAFLLLSVSVSIAYGIANDLVTSRISPEYFLFFKGAAERVPVEAAADPVLHRAALDWQAIRIGTLATWSVGLIAGALLLIANTLGRRPRLTMRKLARSLPLLIGCAILGAAVLGPIGYAGGLTWMSQDFRVMVASDEMRPFRLMAVYGLHLGGYVGAGIGCVGAMCWIIWQRRRSAY